VEVIEMRTGRRAGRGILIIVAAALLALAACDGGDEAPATNQPTEATGARGEANALEIATDFFNATIFSNEDRAVGMLADDADLSGWGLEGIREFRVLMRFWEATGFKHMLDSCVETSSLPFGTVVRCTYDFHGIRSDEIGRGPYSGSYDEITVRDGEIVDVYGNIEIAKFSPQMWEPFAEWISTNYPDDVVVMYRPNFSDYRLTPESIRLWEQHSREYVKAVEQGTA